MATDATLAPDFIRFLFSAKPKFDCHFVVGNKNQGDPERIGAVKLMLMAHSEVFRLQLEDSDLKEKGDIPVEDVHPDSFKGMLKYVYGHDITSDMCFDEADNLFYVAEKYMIQTLKDKLAVRLMKLLNPDNLCSLLNNPACYTHLELNSAITQILRFETDRVLANPQFLSAGDEFFLKILEQDGLVVSEIDLWRAAIKWAKHRANSDDGQLLRQQISSLTPQMRLCTLTIDEFREVIPSGVLSSEEINALCLAIGKKEEPQGLNDFSNETKPRERLSAKSLNVLYVTCKSLIKVDQTCDSNDYNFTILTKQRAIEVLPLVCLSQGRDSTTPENWTCLIDCKTTITKGKNHFDPDSSSTTEPPITLTFREKVKFGVEFKIPLTIDGKNIILSPDTKYEVKMEFNGPNRSYYRMDKCENSVCSNTYMTLSTSGHKENTVRSNTYTTGHRALSGRSQEYNYYYPFYQIQYKVAAAE